MENNMNNKNCITILQEIIKYDAGKYYLPGWLSIEKTAERTKALTYAIKILEKNNNDTGTKTKNR
jgi:hypothetical protein